MLTRPIHRVLFSQKLAIEHIVKAEPTEDSHAESLNEVDTVSAFRWPFSLVKLTHPLQKIPFYALTRGPRPLRQTTYPLTGIKTVKSIERARQGGTADSGWKERQPSEEPGVMTHIWDQYNGYRPNIHSLDATRQTNPYWRRARCYCGLA